MKKSRAQLIQWLLNKGAGITYTPEGSETTEKEKTEQPFGCVRYVNTDYADWFEKDAPFPEQVDYAIEDDMDLIDFDEWQMIQRILFRNEKQMSYECALKINGALWEHHDVSPLELKDPLKDEEASE